MFVFVPRCALYMDLSFSLLVFLVMRIYICIARAGVLLSQYISLSPTMHPSTVGIASLVQQPAPQWWAPRCTPLHTTRLHVAAMDAPTSTNAPVNEQGGDMGC